MEHLCLIGIVMTRSLRRWAEIYGEAALPSEILERLGEGILRRKRYLALWVTSWLAGRRRKLLLVREAEAALSQEPIAGASWEAPDPVLRQRILLLTTTLTPTQQDTLLLLAQDLSAKDIAQLRGISRSAAWSRVSEARAALQALQKIISDF